MIKARPECIPCIVGQALKVAKKVSHDEWLQRKVLTESMKLLSELDFNRPPAEITFDVVSLATKTLGSQNCFEEDKNQYTQAALASSEKYRKVVEDSDDRLLTAAKLATAGGVFDINTPAPIDLTSALDTALEDGFAIDDFDDFRKDLDGAKNVLYILGNAGEAVLDRLLADELKNRTVTCVASRSPVLLKATVEDATESKLDLSGKIIDSGVDALGTPPELVSADFKETLKNADIIIAKGKDNFETLSGAALSPMYFALRATCTCTARSLGVKVGELAFIKNTGE